MYYVYGGSFNPPTLAHLKIIEKIKELPSCEKVIILPVGDDYKKPYLVKFEDRKKMLELALKDLDDVLISTLEQAYPYQGTLHSLNELKKLYEPICFVIGSDQLSTLDKWISYEDLLKSYTFVILQRDQDLTFEQVEQQFKHVKHQFIWVPFAQDISATKARLDAKNRAQYLNLDVISYIDTKGLYKE
ncbi:MAG: nicotinate (nicotinamide) nucleotide adenylyltransferase [Acholeplasmataceae bacterium]